MNAQNLSSTSPIIGSLPTFSARQNLKKSTQLRNPSNIRTDKTMDIFIPANGLSNTMSPPRKRRNTTTDTMPLVRPPNVDSSPSSPRSTINFVYSKNTPKSVKKISNGAKINTNEIGNFNKDLANNFDIIRLKDLYDKEEIPFVDLNYLTDNDYSCRVNPNDKIPSRDPSLNILLKHNLPRVSINAKEQTKFFVDVIYESITNTRNENYYGNHISDEEVNLSTLNFPQMICEMDIWLSTLNECIKLIGPKMKPVSLILLVAQKELKRTFKKLLTAVDNQLGTPSNTRSNQAASQSILNQSSKSQIDSNLNVNSTVDKTAVIGALKRDIQRLEERITELKCDVIAAQISTKDQEKKCERLLSINQQLRETIITQERKVAAMSDKSGEISSSGLGQVPDAAQVVWGELSSFARDLTKALKKVNVNLLLPESTAQLNQPKVGLNAPTTAATSFKAKAARRKSYASTVQNNLLFDFDIYSLANATEAAEKDAQNGGMTMPTPAPPQRPTMVRPSAATGAGDSFPRANAGVAFPPANSGGGDAFPKSNAGAAESFPRAGPTMAPPPANSGGGDAFPRANTGATDAFPRAGPTMVRPTNSGGGDAFPRSNPGVAFPPANSGGGDAFPKANTGATDAFPRAGPTMAPPPANSGGGDAFPKANTGATDAFPRANPGVAFPPASSGGGDAFPKANTGPADAFPRANPGVAFPPANSGGGDAFPKASTGSTDSFPRANPGVSFPPASNGGGDAFPKASISSSETFPRSKPSGDSLPRTPTRVNAPTPSFADVPSFPSLASKPSPSEMNVPLGKSSSAPVQKRIRAPTRPNKKLHFTNFFPDMCNFTDTCSGALLSKPPTSIYTQLESELRQFLVQVFQKYKERMSGVRTEVEKMSDKFNDQLAHIKEGLGTRSLWACVLFKQDDFISLPKDVKVPDDYQVTTFSEIARAIVEKMRPQESKEFVSMISYVRPNTDSNQESKEKASSEKVPETMRVRPTTASDVLFDVFPANLIEKMIDFIAYVNKTSKSDISVDMFRRFFSADLPFTHFIFFCKFYLFSLSLTGGEVDEQQLRVNALSTIFNRYGYSTTFPEDIRSSLEEQYCASLPSFIVFAMSLYTHIISKLSAFVESEMNNQKTSSPSSKRGGGGGVAFRAHGILGKQQFLLNYLKESVINYVEPEKPKPKTEEEEDAEELDEEELARRKEEEKRRKEEKEKERQKMMMSPEKEAENKNAVEYMKAIAGSAKDLSFVEVAVEMFNYVIPLENSLEDFDPQSEDLLVYLSTFGVKPKKGKKGKDKVKKVLEPIKPGDLITK